MKLQGYPVTPSAAGKIIKGGAYNVRQKPMYGPKFQYTGFVATHYEGYEYHQACDYNGKPTYVFYDEGRCYHAEQDGKILCWFYAGSLEEAKEKWAAIIKEETE